MNLKEYDKLQRHEVNNQIAIDFDGVIHKSSNGFGNGGVYDPPTKGSVEALKWFQSNGYTIIIFTAKVKADRPLVNGKTGEELIWEWLKYYKIDHYIKEVTCEKPRAFVYIDDRGLRFESWDQTISDFKRIMNDKY